MQYYTYSNADFNEVSYILSKLNKKVDIEVGVKEQQSLYSLIYDININKLRITENRAVWHLSINLEEKDLKKFSHNMKFISAINQRFCKKKK